MTKKGEFERTMRGRRGQCWKKGKSRLGTKLGYILRRINPNPKRERETQTNEFKELGKRRGG